MRKRTVWFLVSMMVLLGCGVSLLAGAAIIAKDFSCGMLDAAGGFVTTTDSQSVTNMSSGVTNQVCKATAVPNTTGAAVVLNFDNTGIQCGTNSGPTDDWQETISADGQATLTCHLNVP